MSFSVDDLVSSLASNHIGQEAIDLANLQFQLTQTLSYVAGQQKSEKDYVPCNTPTARTPSNSHWAHLINGRRQRSLSVASTNSKHNSMDRENDIVEEAMETDEEYAVEQLITASPSNSFSRPTLTDHLSTFPSASSLDKSTFLHNHHEQHSFESMSPNQTSFINADPFYIALLQEQRQPRMHSAFSEAGQPPSQSPFLTSSHRNRRSSLPFAMETEERCILTGASGSPY